MRFIIVDVVVFKLMAIVIKDPSTLTNFLLLGKTYISQHVRPAKVFQE